MTQDIKLTTVNEKEELISKLQSLIPMAFQEGKLNPEILRDLLGEENTRKTFYGLSWPKKLETYQNAINGTNTTFKPRPEDSYQWDKAPHILIKGENLESLKLLKESYKEKVKMIYIDPPYNTGNDSFIYPDKFQQTKKEYKEETAEVDEEGNETSSLKKNTKDSGHFHSNWLNMMLPRLLLARDLLRDDGVIFISIDDNEQANLKLVMDEIFGEENFVTSIVWQNVHTRKNSTKYFSSNHEFILCYAKNKTNWNRNLLPRENTKEYKNPDNHPKGPWKLDPITAHNPYSADYTIEKPNGIILSRPEGSYWRFSEETIKEKIANNEIVWGEGNSYPMIKRFLSDVQDGLVPLTIFDRIFAGDTSNAKKEIDQLLEIKSIFEYTKPSLLIKRLMQISTNPQENDIILDFFAGSGTTSQAIMEMNEEDGGNRRYICVQLPEVIQEKSEAYQAGYRTVFDITKARIDKVIEKIQKEREGKELKNLPFLGYRLFELRDCVYNNLYSDIQKTDILREQFKRTVSLAEKGISLEEVLWEILIKNKGIDLSTSFEREKKAENFFIYKILSSNDNVILFLEGEAPSQDLEEIILSYHPNNVYALESFFKGEDSLKKNLAFNLERKDIPLGTY